MKKESLSSFIKDLLKEANRGINSESIYRVLRTFGLTEGQVLRVNQNGMLEMQSCWLEISLEKCDNAYQLRLCPVLSDGQALFEYIEASALAQELTAFRHMFGGKTLPLKHYKYYSRRDLQNIETASCVARVIPPVQQDIHEDYGDLAVWNRTIFELGGCKESYLDQYRRYIREYNGIPQFVEPSRETDENGNSDFDEASFRHHDTGHNTVIVPTLWIKGKGRYEWFLDFATDWRQSKYGDRVTGKVGNFIVTHELKNGRLKTWTSLRERDSIFYDAAYA